MLDWDDVRFFLALSRQGSLSAAARDLHVAQSTVGRRLASLESSLGVRLLNRTPEGYVPTPAGQGVRDHAERLEAQALSLERIVGGRDTRMAGLVRVTCPDALAIHVLAPGLASLHGEPPGLMVELMSPRRDLSLSMREADISICLKQPEQHELMVRCIGTIAFGLYAGTAYLRQRGAVDFAEGCAGQHLITQTQDIQDGTQADWLAALAPRAQRSLQTGSHEAAVLAAVHGGGLACLARFRADGQAGLTRLRTPAPAPAARVWLAVHRDNRRTPRIRMVLDHITQRFRCLAPLLGPADGPLPGRHGDAAAQVANQASREHSLA